MSKIILYQCEYKNCKAIAQVDRVSTAGIQFLFCKKHYKALSEERIKSAPFLINVDESVKPKSGRYIFKIPIEDLPTDKELEEIIESIKNRV